MWKKLIGRMAGISSRDAAQPRRVALAVQPFEGRLVPSTFQLQGLVAGTGPVIEATETTDVAKDKPTPPPPKPDDHIRITLSDVLISNYSTPGAP